MRKKLLGLASLLCATTLCVGGATLLNDNATAVAETAETTYTWSTSDGMSFTADELWQMDQMLTEIPRTVEFCANIGSATKNTMVFSNFPTGSVYSYFAVRYINTSGYLDVFYTKTGSGASQGFRSTATVLEEGYHNYSVVLGDNGGYVYVDGELVDTTPVTYVSKKSYEETFTEIPGGYNYCVGGDPRTGNSGFVNDGSIKWISAYSDVRTAEEVAASQTTVDSADENLLFAYDLAEAKAQNSKIIRNRGTVNNPLVSSKADVWMAEVCTDIADYTGADAYAYGVTGASVTRMKDTDWNIQNQIGTDSMGIEFRYKADADSLAAMKAAYWTGKGYAETDSKYVDTIIGVQLGTRVFELDWNPLTNVSRLNTRDVWNGWSGQTGTDKNNFSWGNKSFNPLTTEYYFRALRVKHQWKDTYKYYFYMAPVNADGSLGEEICYINGYEDKIRSPKYDNASYNTVCVYPLTVANSSSYPTYTATISSNKYVGVKTTVDGVETFNKVNRGANFTLADLTAGNVICAGWSKGADNYSTEDYVAAGTVLENVQEPASYTALTMTLEADKAASIRFRQRTVAGEVLPLEISLKWNVKANDSSNVGYYFGGIKFGYVLTADNGKTSGDVEVSNVTDGFTKPYEYGIIQSNIGEASYDMKFTCQAYVELNGVKYYTAAADMENDGRSVDIVADAATADLQSVETNGEYVHPTYGVQYSNAIKDAEGNVIGYHYLTQEQYDLVAKASAVNA